MQSVRRLRQRFEEIQNRTTSNTVNTSLDTTYTLASHLKNSEHTRGNTIEKDSLDTNQLDTTDELINFKTNVDPQSETVGYDKTSVQQMFYHTPTAGEWKSKQNKPINSEEKVEVDRKSSFDQRIFENRQKLYNNYVQQKKQLFELQSSATKALHDIHDFKEKFHLEDDVAKEQQIKPKTDETVIDEKQNNTRRFSYENFVKEKLGNYSSKNSGKLVSSENPQKASPPKSVIRPSSRNTNVDSLEEVIDESTSCSVGKMKKFWDKKLSPRKISESEVPTPKLFSPRNYNSKVIKAKEMRSSPTPWRTSSRNSITKQSPWKQQNNRAPRAKARMSSAGRNSTQRFLLDISNDSINSFHSEPSPHLKDNEVKHSTAYRDTRQANISISSKGPVVNAQPLNYVYGNRYVGQSSGKVYRNEYANDYEYGYPWWAGSFQNYQFESPYMYEKEYFNPQNNLQKVETFSTRTSKQKENLKTKQVSIVEHLLQNDQSTESKQNEKEKEERETIEADLSQSSNSSVNDLKRNTGVEMERNNSQTKIDKDAIRKHCKKTNQENVNPEIIIQAVPIESRADYRTPQLIHSDRSEKVEKSYNPMRRKKNTSSKTTLGELLEKKNRPRKKYSYDIHGRRVYITPNGTTIPTRYLDADYIKELSTNTDNYWMDVSQEAAEYGARELIQLDRSHTMSPTTCINMKTTAGEKEIYKKVEEKIQQQLIEGMFKYAESKYGRKRPQRGEEKQSAMEDYELYLRSVKARVKTATDKHAQLLKQKKDLDAKVEKAEKELQLQKDKFTKAEEEKSNAVNEGRDPVLPKDFIVPQRAKKANAGLGALVMKASSKMWEDKFSAMRSKKSSSNTPEWSAKKGSRGTSAILTVGKKKDKKEEQKPAFSNALKKTGAGGRKKRDEAEQPNPFKVSLKKTGLRNEEEDAKKAVKKSAPEPAKPEPVAEPEVESEEEEEPEPEPVRQSEPAPALFNDDSDEEEDRPRRRFRRRSYDSDEE